ncbi:MAG: hypothetical protein AAF515_20405 [Pseudomonadota bacterium]
MKEVWKNTLLISVAIAAMAAWLASDHVQHDSAQGDAGRDLGRSSAPAAPPVQTARQRPAPDAELRATLVALQNQLATMSERQAGLVERLAALEAMPVAYAEPQASGAAVDRDAVREDNEREQRAFERDIRAALARRSPDPALAGMLTDALEGALASAGDAGFAVGAVGVECVESLCAVALEHDRDGRALPLDAVYAALLPSLDGQVEGFTRREALPGGRVLMRLYLAHAGARLPDGLDG